MSNQFGLLVRNNFSAANNSVDKIFGHLECGVVAASKFVIAIVVAFKVVKSDCFVSIHIFAVRDPGGNKLVVLG